MTAEEGNNGPIICLCHTLSYCNKKDRKKGQSCQQVFSVLKTHLQSVNPNSHLCMNHSFDLPTIMLSNCGLSWVYVARSCTLIGWFFSQTAIACNEKRWAQNVLLFSTWHISYYTSSPRLFHLVFHGKNACYLSSLHYSYKYTFLYLLTKVVKQNTWIKVWKK